MSVSVTVRTNPMNINKGSLLLCDVDQLRTNEINRRRKLRIQQVRQQSKDIANMLRERVRDEAARQFAIFGGQQIAVLKKQQSEQLCSLQQQYQECLQEIGVGHQQAALQPDAAVELARQREINQAVAQERGQEAAAKLKQKKVAAEEQRNAEKKMHKYSCTVENLRSAMVVSLDSKSPKKTRSPKERSHKKIPLQDIPINTIPSPKAPPEPKQIKVKVKSHCKYCSKPECECTCAKEYSKRLRLPLQAAEKKRDNLAYSPILPSNIPFSPITEDVQATEVSFHLPEEQTSFATEKSSEISSELTDKSITAYSGLPHQKLWGFPTSEKMEMEENSSSGMKDYDEPCITHLKSDEIVEEDCDSSTSVASSSCTCFAEPCLCTQLRGLTCRRKVKLYDHGNRYHTECASYPRVERHLYENSEPDAVQAAQMQTVAVASVAPRNAQEALKRVRGNQALMREKISQEYKELLVKLSSLAREERLVRSDPANGLPEEAYWTEQRQKELTNRRQKHMDAAFENVLSDIAPQKSNASPSLPESEPAKPFASEVEESPLKLNVAHCKKISPSKPVPSMQEVPLEKSDEMKHTGKLPSTLEDLMKRVNMQRFLLLEELESQNAPTNEAAAQSSKTEQILQSIHENLLTSLSSVSLGSNESVPNACVRSESINELAFDTGKEEISYSDTDLNNTSSGKRPLYMRHTRTRALGNNFGKKDRERGGKIKNVDESKLHKIKKGKMKQQEYSGEKDKKNSSSSSSVTVVNEYSIDMSRSRTIEHSFDNGVESFNSSTSAYEEVKIIVSVTEIAEQTPPKSPSKKKKQKSSTDVSSPRKPQKQQVHLIPTKGRQKACSDECKTSVSKTPTASKLKTIERKHLMGEKPVRSKEKRTKGAVMQTYDESKQDNSKTWVERLERSQSISNNYQSDVSSVTNPPEHICRDKLSEIDKLHPEVAKTSESKITKPILSCYISRLLAMSRESVQNLHISTSDISSSSLKGTKINAAMQTECIDSSDKRLGDGINTLPQRIQFPHYSEDFKSLHTSSSSAISTSDLHPSERIGVKETKDQTQLVQDEHSFNPSDEVRVLQEGRGTIEENLIPQEGQYPGLTSKCLKTTSPKKLVDLSLDEEKFGEYPQMLDSMTEKCLRNISKLNKSIERIRMEQKKLIEMSFSGSGSSSNGNDNNRSNNSTRYRSPPPTSRIMAPAKAREISKSPIEEVAPTTVTSTPNAFAKALFHLPRCQEKCTCSICEAQNKADSLLKSHQSLDLSGRTRHEPPGRNGNAAYARNLSTIFEVDSNASSQHRESWRNSDRSPSSIGKERYIQKTQSRNVESDNESLPDVMAEMLRRGLITSPLTWSRTSTDDMDGPDQKISISSSEETEKPNNKSKNVDDVQNTTPRILQAVEQMGLNPTSEAKKAFYNSFGIDWEDVISCFKTDSSNQDASLLMDKRPLEKPLDALMKGSDKQLSSSKIRASILRDHTNADDSAETSPAHSDIVEIICNTCNSIMVKCTCDLLPDIPSSENATSDSGF